MQKNSRTCSSNVRCSDPEDTTGLLTAPGTKIVKPDSRQNQITEKLNYIKHMDSILLTLTQILILIEHP